MEEERAADLELLCGAGPVESDSHSMPIVCPDRTVLQRGSSGYGSPPTSPRGALATLQHGHRPRRCPPLLWIGVTVLGIAGCSSPEQAAPLSIETTDVPSVTSRPLGLFTVEQYWPGTDLWPPPSPIGPQVTFETRPPIRTTSAPPRPTLASPELSSIDDRPASPAVETSVLAALGGAESAFDEAMRLPTSPELRTAIAETTAPGSPAETYWLDLYDSSVAQGQRNVAPTDADNSTTILDGSQVLVDGAGTTALVWVCAVSGDTIVRVLPDGTDTIISSGWVAVVQLQVFSLIEGVWKVSSVSDVEFFEGTQSCSG